MNSRSPRNKASHVPPDDSDDIFSDRPRNLRRRKKRRISSTILYGARLTGMAIGGVVFAFVAFRFMQKVVHPYQLGNEVSQQVADARAQYEHQKQENDVLTDRLKFLRSKEGAELEARRAGFHRKGEIIYLLPKTPEAP